MTQNGDESLKNSSDKLNTLKEKSGKEIAVWHGDIVPAELRAAVKILGRKVVVKWA